MGGDQAPQRLDRGDAGDEAKLRRPLGRHSVAENEACMEIAGGGDPLPASPPAPPALSTGDDPQRTALALPEHAPPRFVIRRIQLVECDEAHALGLRLLSEREPARAGQNSDFAAALAAVISGAGYSQKTSRKIVETAKIARGASGAGSKAGAGSSKYIVLTMRK